MATQQVKILVIGGKQAQGCGLRAGQSFVEQLARRFEQTGQQVFVEYHVPVDLPMATSILYYVNVHRYDLIVLQMGHRYLQYPLQENTLSNDSNDLPVTQGAAWHWFVDRLKVIGLTLINSIKRVSRLRELVFHLSDTLHYLQPYNHKVILMTPFPHQDIATNWLRREAGKLFLNMGSAYGTPVLNTSEFIQNSEEYFLTTNRDQLSPVGHELLGCALYDAYQLLKVPHSSESRPFNPSGPRLPRGY